MAKKLYTQSKELADLITQVIQKENLQAVFGDPVIDCLTVYPNISQIVAGRCIKTSKELEHYSNCDFIVEVSKDLWDNLDEESQYILILHELMHIKREINEKTEEVKYSIQKHDIEDFVYIIEKYGIDWMKTLKTVAASVYDTHLSQLELKF